MLRLLRLLADDEDNDDDDMFSVQVSMRNVINFYQRNSFLQLTLMFVIYFLL